MRKHIQALPLALLFLLGWSLPLHAYTFFIDEDPAKKQSVSFWPLPQDALTFWMDADPFALEEQTFAVLAQTALSYWTQAPAMALRLRLNTLSVDVNATNIQQHSRIDDQRPDIILEQDGKILESLGLDAEYVLGIGIPIVEQNQQGTLTGPFGGKIVDAFVLINTTRLPKAARLQRLLTHEIGHALGIGHTNVVHLPNAEKLPVMFFDTGVQQSAVTSHADDLAAISSLYPNQDYERRYGAIEGEVRRADQSPIFGAVVIAEPTDGSAPIAAWSDPNGRFGLYGLPPNTYTLHTRALYGDRFLFSMDPALHVGGIYKKATREFCPESYNDLPFVQCRIQPTQSTVISVRAGQRWTGLIIREKQGNPSPPPICRLGSSPQLPEHPFQFPTEVPNQGLRGAPCPPEEIQTEPPSPETSEPTPTESTMLPPDGSTTEPPPQDPDKNLPTGCQCQNHSTPLSLWFVLLLLGALYARRRTHRALQQRIRALQTPRIRIFCVFFWGMALVWGLCVPSVSVALSVRKPSFVVVAQRAQMVIRARVVAQQTHAARPLPLLHTTFASLECLKGPCHRTFVLFLPAIRHGRYRLFTSGIPRFSQGQEYILFVRPNHREAPILVGLSFGIFDVHPDPQQHVHSRGLFFAPMPLAAFRRKLRDALRPTRQATSRPTQQQTTRPTSRPNTPNTPSIRVHHAHFRAASQHFVAKPRTAVRYLAHREKSLQTPAKKAAPQEPNAR